MSAAIEIISLSVTLDNKQILSDITASVSGGEIVGLLGPSGAGKTTLIRTILGLQKPSSGSIKVLGSYAGGKKLKSEIGYVSQAPSVYADLSVLENVQYFASLTGASRQEVSSIIQVVELVKLKNRPVSDLSGGEKARVSLAAALLGNPNILLLDEPTVGLDPVLRESLWSLFRELSGKGITILISSHVMDEAGKCDSLMFVRDGRLLISDTKENVLSKTNAKTMEEAFLNLARGVET